MKFDQTTLKLVANILVIAGALNWLGVGLQNVNYVGQYAGPNANYVYIAVGLAGAYLLFNILMNFKNGKMEALSVGDLLKMVDEKQQ